ncbi:NAD(P)-dependent oxidoreductase [Chungangia koreensis]|uniref:NAD(P)-dependent oxidoreductase n=1 Tax=Chungangia koreensis TaxID=752657 RepID=A0ABV8X2P9_9LACT
MEKSLSIGFIGTGVMGKSIVRHLLKAGHKLTVYSRTKEKAADLLEEGAVWADHPSDAAKNAEVVFTMVGYPSDVEEVYFGEHGIFTIAEKGQIVVDMTTSEPTLAIRIAEQAAALDMHSIDAPVSGGDVGAKNGTLSIMCGGEKEVFDRLLPVFSLFGGNIVYQGKAGAGQHTKMSNQIAISTNMIGVCEALVYAKKAGLDLETVLKSISSGAAGSWSLSNYPKRILQGDLEPGFYIKHFLKDMRIALMEAEQMGLELPGLKLAKEIYDQLAEDGYKEKGIHALIRYYMD